MGRYPKPNKHKLITLSLPPDMLEYVEKERKKLKVPRSRLIQYAIWKYLNGANLPN